MTPAEKAAIAAKGAEAAADIRATEEQVDALVRLFAKPKTAVLPAAVSRRGRAA